MASRQQAIDISMLGDEALSRALAKLVPHAQKKAVRSAVRNEAKRMRPLVAAATPVDTGRLKREMETAPIRGTTKKGVIRMGMVRPPGKRESIQLNTLEYGSAKRNLPPLRFVRNTVDKHAATGHRNMGRDIRRSIEKEWGKWIKV